MLNASVLALSHGDDSFRQVTAALGFVGSPVVPSGACFFTVTAPYRWVTISTIAPNRSRFRRGSVGVFIVVDIIIVFKMLTTFLYVLAVEVVLIGVVVVKIVLVPRMSGPFFIERFCRV